MFIGSYVLLWVVVMLLAVVTLGALRQIGLLRLQVGSGPADDTSSPPEYYMTAREVGPEIGTTIQPTSLTTANGYGDIQIPDSAPSTLLVFLTPLCDGCQAAVDPINAAMNDPGTGPRIITVVSGDERAISSFINLFPLHMPVVADVGGVLASNYNVAGGPIALLYDGHNRLIRKALLGGRAYVLPALLHGAELDTGIDLYPPLGQGLKEVTRTAS